MPLIKYLPVLVTAVFLQGCQSWGLFWESGTSVAARVFSTTASRVYGQFGSFACAVSDNTGSCVSGGATKSANGLNQPNAIAFDAGGAYIVEKGNNRVLYFANGSTTASRVYGQLGSFTCGVVNISAICSAGGSPTASTLNLPTGVATDAGGVYIADSGNNRILYFAGTSTTATRVYGQYGLINCNTANTDNVCGASGATSAENLDGPFDVTTDATGVYVSDYNNHRVLYYAGASTVATRVYGQNGNFNTNGSGTTADFLMNPFRTAVDASGVYIADFSNNRVLFYSGTSIIATRVYGQAGSFTSGTANFGGRSANSIAGPTGVAVDSLGIYVSELSNNRVLFFPGSSTSATRVYGQGGSFSSAGVNPGGVSANSLFQPIFAGLKPEGLYIMDAGNHRGLFY